jgi:nucleotide-binding universal stress UspA family protein
MVEETVAWAVKFAKTHHAQVIFLALQARRRRGSSPGPDERLEELRVRLMNTCSDLRASGVKVILRVLRGDPSTCALGSVAENDLLLVTAPCHQDLERILLRSIEERVLVRSEVPVIILKERDDSPDPSARRARSG